MLLKGIAILSGCFSLLTACLSGAFGGLSFLWKIPVWFVGCYGVLLLLAFGFLAAICLVVDPRKPQEHDSKFYRSVMHVYVEALISLVRVRVHPAGLENTPTSGRFLLVCNHLHMADPGVLLHYFKDSQLAFISKKENKSMFLVGKIMHKIMCQLIDRENDRAALKTILRCIQLIKEDEVSICVFPEGYTSLDGRLHHFRSGAFKIAQKSGVPIVVCTLQNTQDIFRNLLKFRPTDVPLHLVKVITPEEYKGMTTVEISSMVYEMMIADLGEDYRVAEA